MTQTALETPRTGWRIAGWGALAALLALPAIAMQFTREVDWTASDFVFAAILLGSLGLCAELVARSRGNRARRVGLGIAAVTGFLTLWSNAAVGFIGDEGAGINAVFFAVPLAFLALALLARGRGRILVAGALAAGLAHPLAGLVATRTMPGHAVEWGVLAVFGGLWLAAATALARARA